MRRYPAAFLLPAPDRRYRWTSVIQTDDSVNSRDGDPSQSDRRPPSIALPGPDESSAGRQSARANARGSYAESNFVLGLALEQEQSAKLHRDFESCEITDHSLGNSGIQPCRAAVDANFF